MNQEVASVVIVGAGPAGMAAAKAAADAGAPVTLLDSAPRLGGQYHRQSPAEPERFRLPPSVEYLPETAVWSVEPISRGHRLHTVSGPADGTARQSRHIDTRALVLTPGAYDRALPFPGWDLPGVYTAGAAQALAKGQGVAVGRRVALAGTGPFLLPVAAALRKVGAKVVSIMEANQPVTGWLRQPGGALAGSGKAAELAGYLSILARERIPYLARRTVIAAHGTDQVEAITTARLDQDWRPIPGSRERVEVDAVCVGFGFLPQLELAVAAGCHIQDGFVEVNTAQATSVSGVFAAGEVTGVGGAVLAADEGTVAGTAAALMAGSRPKAPLRALRRVRNGRKFAEALQTAYPIRPGWRDWLDDNTLVCRCEEVTLRGLHEAIDERDVHGVRSLKLTCRAGLGPCQGRVCGQNVAELAGLSADAFARRPIAAPIRLGEVADIQPPEKEK